MSSFEEMAATLFGATTPTSQPNHSTGPANHGVDNAAASRMFPNMARSPAPQANEAEQQPLNDDERAERLFATNNPSLYHGDSMRSIEQAAMESFFATPEEAVEAADHWGEVYQSVGLNGTESVQLTEIGISAFKNPPTPELRTSWVEQSQQALVQDYGPQGARAALEDARALVANFGTPELREILDGYGLGDHPAVIRTLAAKARAMRQAGKL